MSTELGRNEPCHCGSGKKYKKCHLEKDALTDSKQREKVAAEIAKKAAAESAEGDTSKKPPPQKGAENQSWVQKIAGKTGFFRNLASQRRAPPSNKGG